MSTQVVERQQSAIEIFRSRLITRRSELEDALRGSGISADRFIRTALSAAQANNDLVSDVSFQSLWAELLKACRDQLLPDGRQGAIVVFKGRAKWIPMYRGLLDRFEQSGEYKWVTANLHREDDIAWDVWIDEQGQHFLHRPGPGRGRVIETYAAAMTKSGGFFLSVVTEPDMDHIKAVSRAKSEDAPWQQWPDEMRKKTAIRRLCKVLPMPQPVEDLINAIDGDDEPAGPQRTRALPRPRGAQNALEQFGEAEPDKDRFDKGDNRFYREREPEQQAAEQSQVEQQTDQPKTDQPKESTVPQALLDTAHERGQQAKRDNMKRTAIPPEYRVPERGQEAIAWRKGFDGEPLDAPSGDGNAQ